MDWSVRNCPVPEFVLEPEGEMASPANPAAVVLAKFCQRVGCSRDLSVLLRESSLGVKNLSFAEPRVESRILGESAGSACLQCRVWSIPLIDHEQATKDRLLIYILVDTDNGEAGFGHLLKLSIAREIFWDEYARSYDRILPLLSFYQVATDRHVSAITQTDPKEVLDLGAGTGNVAVRLAEHGCRITLVDTSAAMLERARQKAIVGKLMDRFDIVEQSAEEIDSLATESFDAINMLLAAFCMDDATTALEHAVRVLRPGGLLVFTEPTRSFDEGPLIAAGEAELKIRADWSELDFDWRVVANAGHRLGRLIRKLDGANPQSSGMDRKLRADDLPKQLERLGCDVESEKDSHLGQCRYIVARKHPHRVGR